MSPKNSLWSFAAALLFCAPVYAATATPAHTHPMQVATPTKPHRRAPSNKPAPTTRPHARAGSADQVYSKEVEEYQRAAMLNEARIRYAKSLAELRKLEEKANGAPTSGTTSSSASSSPSSPAPHSAGPSSTAPRAPHVSAAEKALQSMSAISVWGVAGGHNMAEIFVGSGSIDAPVGYVLPGGWTIVSIKPFQVLVRHGRHGRLHELAFKSPQLIRKQLGLSSPNSQARNPVAMPITAPPSLTQIQ